MTSWHQRAKDPSARDKSLVRVPTSLLAPGFELQNTSRAVGGRDTLEPLSALSQPGNYGRQSSWAPLPGKLCSRCQLRGHPELSAEGPSVGSRYPASRAPQLPDPSPTLDSSGQRGRPRDAGRLRHDGGERAATAAAAAAGGAGGREGGAR